MIKYAWFPEIRSDGEGGHYHTYGIAAFESGRSRYVSDITTDKYKIKALVYTFNNERLELSQLDEAIEDFLYDFEV